MAFRNAEQLKQLLVRSRLLQPREIDEVLTSLNTASPSADQVLKTLESSGVLTAYQSNRLAQGTVEGLIYGDYKVMYRNASGGFARVFRACSLVDGEMVGLKVLRQRWVSNPNMVRQFFREAETCAKLKHPNIVPIFEVGTQGETPFFSMEFVEGGNLRDFIKIRSKLSIPEASRCVLGIAEGLSYALKMNVMHRDLKLNNVLMSIDGVAKLVDFGLGGEGSFVDDTGGGQRAVEYAAIESLGSSKRDDPRSDLFFLGAIYHELLTGVAPWEHAVSREDRRSATRYTNIRPVRSHDPNLPRNITDIVDRLLQTNVSARYQTPHELAKDLREIVAGFDAAEQHSGGSPRPGTATGNNTSTAAAEIASSNGAPRETSSITNNETPHSSGPAAETPSIMCVEERPQHQDVLRKYFTTHGFRVMIVTDVQRGLSRLDNNPPDCLVLMGNTVGAEISSAYADAMRRSAGRGIAIVALLSEQQADRADSLEQSETSRVLVQPVKLRDLRHAVRAAINQARGDVVSS